MRRVLQGIQFLTPLEIEHAVIRTTGSEIEIFDLLKKEGYTSEEIRRALTEALGKGVIIASGERKYSIETSRVDVVRKYCILDVIANYGGPISVGKQSGNLLIAGFETSWGLPQNVVIKKAQEIFPGLDKLWNGVQDAFDDVQWLISNGFVIAR